MKKSILLLALAFSLASCGKGDRPVPPPTTVELPPIKDDRKITIPDPTTTTTTDRIRTTVTQPAK